MISFDYSLYSSSPEVCTKEKFLEFINSEKVKAQCEKINVLKLREIALRAEGKEKEADDAHKLASHEKEKLPVFVPGATFTKGAPRRTEYIRQTYIVPIDIDFGDNQEKLTDPVELDRKIHEMDSQWYDNMVLYASISCSGTGLRYFVLRDPRYSFAETLEWFAKTFEVTVDMTGKDITRCSFISYKDNILKVDDRMFLPTEELKQEAERLTGRRFEDYETEETQFAEDADEAKVMVFDSKDNACLFFDEDKLNNVDRNEQGQLVFKGIPYSSIMEKYIEQIGGIPKRGERNTKMFKTALALRYICDDNPHLLFKLLRPYANDLSDTELMNVCKNAIKNEMNIINIRKMNKVVKEVENEMNMSNPDKLNALEVDYHFWNSRLDEIKLPKGLLESTHGVPEELKMGCVMVSLVCIYTLLTRVNFLGYDGREYRLSGQTFIVGEAGTGKSFITQLSDLWLKRLAEQDEAAREAEEKWREEKQKAGQGKMATARPKMTVRIVPSGISIAMLIRRLMNAFEMVTPHNGDEPYKQYLHLVTVEPEMATAIRNLGNQFSKYTDFLLKAFQDEKTGTDYMNEQSSGGIVEVHWNTIFAGVPTSLWSFIGDVTNGLCQRMMLFIMPTRRYQMIEKGGFNRSKKDKKAIEAMAALLDGDEDHRIGGRVDVTALTDHMYEWCKAQMEYSEAVADVVLDRFCRRAALKGIRAGVAFAIMSNISKFQNLKWKKMVDDEWARVLPISENAKKFAVLVAEFSMEMDLLFFGNATLDAMIAENKKLAEGSLKRKKMISEKTRNQFAVLKHEFTVEDLIATEPGLKKGCAYTKLSRWIKDSYIIRNEEKKCYVKVVESI